MGINLLAPKGSNENMKLADKIYQKLNEIKKQETNNEQPKMKSK